jgi:hypothetical protein
MSNAQMALIGLWKFRISIVLMATFPEPPQGGYPPRDGHVVT